LGNPGKVYENTYHNAGFLLIDYLLSKKPAIPNFEFRISKLLKPDVYMNESGGFVKKALKRKGAKPEEVLIVHDDSDLSLSSCKLDFDRGSAGHKGVASVINALGTKKFWRLRIGIRPKISELALREKAKRFVLKKIRAGDKKILEKVLEVFQGLKVNGRDVEVKTLDGPKGRPAKPAYPGRKGAKPYKSSGSSYKPSSASSYKPSASARPATSAKPYSSSKPSASGRPYPSAKPAIPARPTTPARPSAGVPRRGKKKPYSE